MTTPQEYRKTLSDKQAKAFNQLLEKKLRESGYYARNIEANSKIEKLQRQARIELSPELEAIRAETNQKKAEIRAKIQELHDQERALDEAYRQADEEIWGRAMDSVKDEVEAIIKERGDGAAERRIIESLAISEYQTRLEKKNKAVA